MLKSSQPTTPAPASPQVTHAVKDSSKPVKKKQNVVEGSSPGVEISLPTSVTAFNYYKALIQGVDQFLLPAVVLEKEARLEELERQVAELSTNDDRLQMKYKAECNTP
ncbi:hypothetical protein ACOSQ3_027037 [Xanthoceras sorbifolium]